MQINSINQNYSSMNFSGIFGKRDAKKTEHKDQNQDNSTIPVHSASKPSAKTRKLLKQLRMRQLKLCRKWTT